MNYAPFVFTICEKKNFGKLSIKLMESIELTAQQRHVIERALAHKNLQILALAGCAKTTTSLQVAQALYNAYGKKTLILSYNTALKNDTSKRITKLKMRKYCTVRTIHSAVGFYANPRQVVNNDLLMQAVVDSNVPLTPVDYDVIVLDEAQDFTPLLYSAVRMLLTSTIQVNQRVQILILGDIFQRIYGFRNASCEYLMYPQRYFFDLEFEQCRLSVNFRCSKKILDWVNREFDPRRLEDLPHYREWFQQNQDVLLAAWGVGLEASPQAVRDADDCPDVKEVSVNWFNKVELCKAVENEMKEHREQRHSSNSIYFIATSTEKGPLQVLSLRLGVFNNIYFSAPEERGNPRLEKNKSVMSTICNMKGREADHVKVFPPGAYFENRELSNQKQLNCAGDDTTAYDPSSTFNSAYTACTRARKSMTVYWTGAKPSYLTGGQEIVPENITVQTFSVSGLCAFASQNYEPLQLERVCTQTLMALPEGDNTPYFNDAESRLYPGRCLYERPTIENYAPVIGSAVVYSIGNSFNLLLPVIPNKLNDIRNQLNRYEVCHCAACPDAPCGLNIKKREQFEQSWETTGRDSVTWDQMLQLGVYEYGTKSPQMCRQLVGTCFINKGLLNISRDRGVQIVQQILEETKSSNMTYQQALSGSTSLGFVRGQADFLVGPSQVVIECKITHEITEEHIMQALLYSALTPHFGQPCYVIAPNLNKCLRIQPLPGITATYLLEHAIRRKLGC